MDAGQNGQQGGEKKTQLSWSQPISTPPQQKPVQKTGGPVTPPEGHGVRNAIIGIIVVLIVVGGVWALVARQKTPATPSGTVATSTPSNTASTTSSGTATLSDGSLVIPSPQNAGLQVSVSHVTVSVPTWVVVYENYNGQPGNALGAALFVSGRESGAVDLLRGTLPGQTYFAGEARDDGDHMFSKLNDSVVRDAGGNPVWIKFETK